MANKIWLDGQLVDEDQAKISVFDHGLLYGDGIFEGIRVYKGKVFKLEEHLNRLYESAKCIRLEIGLTIEELTKATLETVKANGLDDNGYIRLVVTRGVGNLGLNPFLCKKATTFIIADQIQLYPKEFYENGMKVISGSVLRNHPLSLPPQIKSLNYLNNILAKIEAVDAGVSEVIMYNHLGFVAEASGDNVFIVKGGVIYTPPTSAGSLEGITRATVFDLARAEGIEVIEKDMTRMDLYLADEFFLTGTAAEVIGVVDIDSRIIGDGTPGPITKMLKKKFYEYACS